MNKNDIIFFVIYKTFSQDWSCKKAEYNKASKTQWTTDKICDDSSFEIHPITHLTVRVSAIGKIWSRENNLLGPSNGVTCY